MNHRQAAGDGYLGPSDPPPVLVHGEGRMSAFLLVSDHAGNAVPQRLGSLGLSAARLEEHIAWDINAWPLTMTLADLLDAPALGQAYSRLVIDSNRRPEAPDSIAEISDQVMIPSNRRISQIERAARAAAILLPYQRRVAEELDRRRTIGPVCIVSMHTFTPRLASGSPRPWHIGVISGPDSRMREHIYGDLSSGCNGLVVGENEPYSVNIAHDYTLPVHGEANGVPYVEFELRNDLFRDETSRQEICGVLAAALKSSFRDLGSSQHSL